MERIIEAFIGPEAGDSDNTVMDFPEGAQVLAGDEGGVSTLFPIAGFVNDEHAALVGACGGIGQATTLPSRSPSKTSLSGIGLPVPPALS
jgi:hypothetical protein